MNRGKNKGFIIYLSVILVVIALCFEFLILPYHYRMNRQSALLGFAAVPGITVDDTQINDMGFTGDVISPHKEHGTVRILTLGGSTLFDRKMTEKLKEHFQSRSDTPVEILGAALRTHTSMSSLLKYRMLSDYQFDYVLVYHGINDLFVNHVQKEFFHEDYSHMSPWYRRNAVLDRSLVARFFYNNFVWGRRIFGDNKASYIYPGDHGRKENAMAFISEQLFKRNLAALVEEVRKNNSTPVLMTFAWSIPERYNREDFLKNAIGYNKSSGYHSYPVEFRM
jgi:hypothetical protein